MSTAAGAPTIEGATADTDGYGPSGRSDWLDIDWREHLRSVEIDARRVSYVELGEGAPVVFVHGLSGCWQNWLENIPHFARRHRVIAFDLPGFGRSDMPREEISIPGYAQFVDSLLETLGADGCHMIGNSMGGFIAAEVAASYPSRVSKLVLVSPAGAHRRLDGGAPRRMATIVSLTRPVTVTMLRHSDTMVRRPGTRRLLLGFVIRHPELLGPEICSEMAKGGNKPGFFDALHAVLRHSVRDRAAEIVAPTLLVWGRNDRIVPIRYAGEYERLIPNARKVIFEDTGHVAMLERPARFNELVGEFLDGG